jgi:hypothetical protein
MIERLMREPGRRLKRIAFGCSERGAAKMVQIIIKRVTSAREWTAYWPARLRITVKVTPTLERFSSTLLPQLLGQYPDRRSQGASKFRILTSPDALSCPCYLRLCHQPDT